MRFPAHFVDQNLYSKSIYDVIEDVNGILVCRHPLLVVLAVSKKQRDELKKLGIDQDGYVRQQLQKCEEAWEKRDAGTYVFAHARPFRLLALLDARSWAAELEWFALAGEVWIDSEGPGINANVWRSEIFDSPLAFHMMDDNERSYYGDFRKATVYRGADSRKHAREGLSWTLDKEKAEWFARRSKPKHAWLASVQVEKEHVATFFFGRGEEEVILRRIPRSVFVTKL